MKFLKPHNMPLAILQNVLDDCKLSHLLSTSECGTGFSVELANFYFLELKMAHPVAGSSLY